MGDMITYYVLYFAAVVMEHLLKKYDCYLLI